MIKNSVIFLLITLLFLVLFSAICSAGDCAYGSVKAWFKKSNGPWENATAHPVLHPGETFEIQVLVTTGTALSVFFLKLHEFGTPVYEVLEGPSNTEQLIEHHKIMTAGQRFLYAWKMQVKMDTLWINGYAPLEIYAQFNKNDTELAFVHFDVLTAFIVDKPLENPKNEYTSETNSSIVEKNQNTAYDRIGGISMIIIFYVVFHHLQKKTNH